MQVNEKQLRDQTRLDITLGRLKELNRDERILLGLYVYEYLSAEDIAGVLQLTVEVVNTQLESVFSKVMEPHQSSDSLSDPVVISSQTIGS